MACAKFRFFYFFIFFSIIDLTKPILSIPELTTACIIFISRSALNKRGLKNVSTTFFFLFYHESVTSLVTKVSQQKNKTKTVVCREQSARPVPAEYYDCMTAVKSRRIPFCQFLLPHQWKRPPVTPHFRICALQVIKIACSAFDF